jgi:RNA polymerase sigma-70 factor (ECF subfamily)
MTRETTHSLPAQEKCKDDQRSGVYAGVQDSKEQSIEPAAHFEDLVREHAAALYRYAYWLARDRRQAEDLVQEALLRGWRALPRLRERAAAKAWLFSIVRNEHLRDLGRQPPPAEDVDELELADAGNASAALEMRDALMALPASYAEPLALQVLGGFSCAEIAQMIGATEGATMTRLTRARQALRRIIAPAAGRARKARA